MKADISARALIDSAVAEIEPLVAQKSVTLTKSLPDEDVIISADRERLLQVFSNLLGNALKYTPENGHIQISIVNLSQEVKFSVTDSGPGIRKNDLPRVFDRYWRSEISDKMGSRHWIDYRARNR